MKTKDDLRSALERLKRREPEHLDLIQLVRDNKPLKLHNYNIEKEARKANGTLKNHPDIKSEIEKAELERLYSDITTDSDRVIYALNEQVRELKEKAIKLELSNKSLREEVDRKDTVLKNQIELMDETITALWSAIPPHEVERRTLVMKHLANIIEIDFSKK